MKSRLRPVELGLLIVGAVLYQMVAANYLPVALYIDVTLIVVLYVGWHSNTTSGAVFGSVAGLARDMTLLLPFWGLNGATKTLLGFLASYMQQNVVAESPAILALAIALLSLMDRLLIALFLYLLDTPVTTTALGAPVGSLLTGLVGAVFFMTYNHFKFPEKNFRNLE